MTTPSVECESIDELLSELALGILVGRERAEALAHVETCMRCTTELERLSSAADALLGAAPALDPPLGFEVRVFDRIGLTAARHLRTRRRRVAIAAGALVALLGAFGLGTMVSTHPTAPKVASAPDVETAQLVGSGKAIGVALTYSGNPGWLLMSVVDLRGDNAVACSIITKSGKSVPMGQFPLTNGAATWSVALPIAPDNVERVVLTSVHDSPIGDATFRS